MIQIISVIFTALYNRIINYCIRNRDPRINIRILFLQRIKIYRDIYLLFLFRNFLSLLCIFFLHRQILLFGLFFHPPCSRNKSDQQYRCRKSTDCKNHPLFLIIFSVLLCIFLSGLLHHSVSSPADTSL